MLTLIQNNFRYTLTLCIIALYYNVNRVFEGFDMARPRKGVTADNSDAVFLYFKKALDDYDRCDKILNSPNSQTKAKDALDNINQLQYCHIPSYKLSVRMQDKESLELLAQSGSKITNPTELDKWVLKYVSTVGWKQCLSNIRQNKHSRAASKVSVKIPHSTHSGLTAIAKEKGLTFDGFLAKLLEKERGH